MLLRPCLPADPTGLEGRSGGRRLSLFYGDDALMVHAFAVTGDDDAFGAQELDETRTVNVEVGPLLPFVSNSDVTA